MRHLVVGLMLLAAISGCGRHGANTPQPSIISLGMGNTKNYVYEEVTSPDQIQADDQLQITVDLVQVTAPAGTLSERAEFWAMVDARAFSVNFRHVLDSNGIRVGVMSAGDWSEGRKALEMAPGVMSQMATLAGKSRATVNSRRITQQTIFYFDQWSQLQGRSYENADNFWGVFFAIDPATPGSSRVELAPVVRSARRIMRLNRVGDEHQIEYEQPETVLDAAIKATLPLGNVLVVAPSREALQSSNSLGRAFLTKEELGGLSEQMLLFYPRVYRLNAKGSVKMQRQQDKQRQEAEERAAEEERRSDDSR